MSISKEKFEAYEKVRVSRKTNMFDMRRVEQLSGLFRDEITEIMENYEALSQKFPGVRK